MFSATARNGECEEITANDALLTFQDKIIMAEIISNNLYKAAEN